MIVLFSVSGLHRPPPPRCMATTTGVIDEPQPARALPRRSPHAEVGWAPRRQPPVAGRLGIEVGDRVAIVSHNSADCSCPSSGSAPYGGCSCRSTSGCVLTRSSSSSSTRGCCLVDPELGRPSPMSGRVPVRPRRRRGAVRTGGLGAAPWEPDENATACHQPPPAPPPGPGRAGHPPQPLGRADLRPARGVTDRDVYLHTLPMFHANGWGMPFVTTGVGIPRWCSRKVDGAEILRRVQRYGVTIMCAAPAVVAAVLDAAKTWEGRSPGADGCASWSPTPRRRAEPSPGSRTSSAGVHPDLRADRDPSRC